MRFFRSIFTIINYKTFIITILSVGSTYFCIRFSIQADLPLTLVGIAIVFPVVFSIDSAYNRRERALGLLADFKGYMLALHQASRDWIDSTEDFQNEIEEKLFDIYGLLSELFMSDRKLAKEKERKIYIKFSDLSKYLQKFRSYGLQAGETSRISQYLARLEVAFENLKVIYFYRTPVTLRAYSKVFIYSFPILYGPYFAFVSHDYSQGLAYMMPVVFSFILVGLDNIQDHLEDPFDQIGEDDIKFDVQGFRKMMTSK